DELGGRAWNQHGRRDLEIEAPELARADDVGERLAGGAPRDERVVPRPEAVGLRRLRVGQEALGRPAEDVLREQPRTELRFGVRDAGIEQPLPRGAHASMNAHETAEASFSFS